MTQSLTKHRIAITERCQLFVGKTLHLELALLGDTTSQQERMRAEVGDALDDLIQTIEAFKQDYLEDAPAYAGEQLI